MDNKKTIILDLNGCKYLGEIHQRIKETFGFPDFYGQNWSAFWDLLWSNCDANKVVVRGLDSLSDDLIIAKQKIPEILERLKEFRKDFNESEEMSFEFEIED